MHVKKLFFVGFIFFALELKVTAQEQESSNIQKYTPSKLLEKGKLDVKWFNNLYTQTKADDGGVTKTVPRANFFNSSVEVFTGISNNKILNIGFIVELRANTFGGQNAGSVFSFKNQTSKARSGLGHIAPSIKVAPFKAIPNLSFQSSFYLPLFKEETNTNGYLAQNSTIWQNRFFYDYTFSNKKVQIFSEFGSRLFLGQKTKNADGSVNKNGGYANNSFEIAPGIFVSYFPNSKFTILGFIQHAQLVEINNKFSQNYSALGIGAKYQLSKSLNIEVLYSKFVRGNDSGLGQSFNLGLRSIF